MTEQIPRSIALCDFSNLLIRNFKAMARDAGPNDAGQLTLNQLAEIRTMAERIVVCYDSKPYTRTAIYDQYKAGRTREPELDAIWSWTMERVHKDGYQVARAPGAEADDVAATLAAEYELLGCPDVQLWGNDKDMAQCVTDVVRLCVPKAKGEYERRDAAWVKEKYGVEPKDMALFQGICGDVSDHIPGIIGIGEKGAAKLINAYRDLAGMAVACTAAVEASKMTGKLPVFWANYAKGMALLPKWISLTTLSKTIQLDKPPLAYLERLPMQKLVEEPSEADDSDFVLDEIDEKLEDINQLTPEELAEERRVMAAQLPVEPVKPEPRIGKDPSADEHLKRAAAQRDQRQSTPENAARIAAGNAAERDRHGVQRQDPRVMDERVQPESQAAIRQLGEQLGKEGAPKPSAGGTAEAAAAAPAEVVPPTQGPARQPRKSEALEEHPLAAILPYAAPSWMLSTQPASAGQAFAIAVKLHNSRRWVGRHDNPEQIAAVILRGRELGIGMMTALDAFHVITGRVCASSQLISALAENDPNHEYTMLVELDVEHAIVEIKHKKQPKPVQWSYSIPEAEVLGLLRPSPKTGEPSQWVKRPKTMLAKTAKANGHRFMFPARTLGLHSLETEVDGQEHIGNDD